MRHTIIPRHVGNLQTYTLWIIGSIVFAITLVRSGALGALLSATNGFEYIGSFVAGIFFTSVLTIAPASIALSTLGTSASPVSVALWGACGALMGDIGMFIFFRNTLAFDIAGVVKKSKYKKVLHFFHLGFMKFISPILGALIIASPLPDELGLAMMGLSKTNILYVVPISFVMNFLGILGLIYTTQALS